MGGRTPGTRPCPRARMALRIATAVWMWCTQCTTPVVAGGTPWSLSRCSLASHYFDTTSLSCTPCGTALELRAGLNTTRDVFDNAAGCGCITGHAATPRGCDISTWAVCPTPTCTSCLTSGQAASRTNASACMPCGASTLGLDSVLGDCVCPAGQVLTETTAAGVTLAAKECLPCPAQARVFTQATGTWKGDAYVCAACGDPYATVTATGDCDCQAGYRAVGVVGLTPALASPARAIRCVPTSLAATVTAAFPEASAVTVAFHAVQASAGGGTTTLSGRTSRTLQHYYLPAAVACATWSTGDDTSGCHTLANLCALQLHATATTVCALFTTLTAARTASIHGFVGWATSLPLLYYGADSSAVAVDTALKRPMSFDAGKEVGTSDHLQLYLAAYALNGTFLGLERLTNQLTYCGGSAGGDAPPWLQFGYGYTHTFTCDLKALMTSTAATQPRFYDMYIRDLAADAASLSSTATTTTTTGAILPRLPFTLYPVSVVVVNLRMPDGSTPNVNPTVAAEGDDVHTRRFMLVDGVTGITTAGEASEVLRYAVSMRLTVRARRSDSVTTGRPNTIAPPVLRIEYRERLAATITSDGSGGRYATDTVTLAVEYVTDNTEYGRTVLAMAVSLGMMVVAWAGVRVTAWIRMNARTAVEATLRLVHIVKFLQYLITSFAPAFFWFLWFVTLYWLVFFKLQTSVFALLPPTRPTAPDNEYIPFLAGLCTVSIAYLARIVEAVARQVGVDVFFVDWEKPRGALMRTGQDYEASLGRGAGRDVPGATVSVNKFAPVSVWRTIHAANEWAELQVVRRLHLPLVLLVLVTVMEAGRVKYVATPQPNSMDLSPGEINPVLQFANNVFWWLVVAGVQLVYTVAIGERYVGENPTTRFIDVCTVSKVSLLLMDEKYHGYYIHANAPHEHADGSMQELADHLQEEAAAMRLGRGLPGSPDPHCQTFELHVPALWREMYDRVYRNLVAVADTAAPWGVPPPSSAGMAYPAYPPGGVGSGMGSALTTPSPVASPMVGGGGLHPTSLGAASAVARQRERTHRLAAGFGALTTFLHGFVEESDPDYKRVWRGRTLLQQMFDLPPDVVTEAMMAGGAGASSAMAASGGGGMGVGGSMGMGGGGGVTYMMLDTSYRFERVLFRGLELDLLVWDILVYCFTDYWQQSPTIAALVTFLAASALAWIRAWAGERNLARKTLVDARFLK